MVDRTVAGTQRLIPVLLGEVELPPFATIRVWIDFRGVDAPEYERRFRELVAALKGERPGRPEPDGRLVLPEGTGSGRTVPAARCCRSLSARRGFQLTASRRCAAVHWGADP